MLIKPKVKLEKYGRKAYHVLLDGEHWGNVCGYEPTREGNIKWTALWFDTPSAPGLTGTKIDNRITRAEAVKEIIINTAPKQGIQMKIIHTKTRWYFTTFTKSGYPIEACVEFSKNSLNKTQVNIYDYGGNSVMGIYWGIKNISQDRPNSFYCLCRINRTKNSQTYEVSIC